MVTDIDGNVISINDKLFRSGASMFLVVAGLSIAILVNYYSSVFRFKRLKNGTPE
jgi:hypothetical protein